MKSSETILGLFFADENNMVYENIKFSKEMSQENKDKLMMLPFNFFGPVFLTEASGGQSQWKIELIESTISLKTYKTQDTTVIQSLFNLNYSISTEEGITNLFAIVGSPYTEDVRMIYRKMKEYIHPSIIQGKMVNLKLNSSAFKFQKFVAAELIRGINFIDYSLGTSRKMYWEEQQKYYCVGLIEREFNRETNEKFSCIYTFDENDEERKKRLEDIPSFYVMGILPDYYEKLSNDTLEIFEMLNISSNLRRIELRFQEKVVIYVEEYEENLGKKRSYGVILIPADDSTEYSENISAYRKNLRLHLDGSKTFEQILEKINPRFNLKKWGCSNEEELNNISRSLDC